MNQGQETKNTNFEKGEIILIDKPLHWTSFNVVHKIKNLIKQYCGIKKIKIGHAGTLDPLATGILILCTGAATKKINNFMPLTKTYVATIRFGATTPSFDLETEINNHYEHKHITTQLIQKTLTQFMGEIFQKPPLYSAKWINGKRAYNIARKGIEAELMPVKITISKLEIISYEAPVLNLLIECSKGTYIRSLAHDLGQALNSGAHLTSLRRISIGSYSVENAHSIEDFENNLKKY